jgi:hypothetical protein
MHLKRQRASASSCCGGRCRAASALHVSLDAGKDLGDTCTQRGRACISVCASMHLFFQKKKTGDTLHAEAHPRAMMLA